MAVRKYLCHLVPGQGYEVSGIRVLGLEGLREENAPGSHPGRWLWPNGYLTVPTSIGGNVIWS